MLPEPPRRRRRSGPRTTTRTAQTPAATAEVPLRIAPLGLQLLPGRAHESVSPSAPIVATVLRVSNTKGTRLVVIDCSFCRKRHVHGWPYNPDDVGLRVAHCGGGRQYRIEAATGASSRSSTSSTSASECCKTRSRKHVRTTGADELRPSRPPAQDPTITQALQQHLSR